MVGTIFSRGYRSVDGAESTFRSITCSARAAVGSMIRAFDRNEEGRVEKRRDSVPPAGLEEQVVSRDQSPAR